MSVGQQTGFMRADLTGLAYIYALPSYKGRNPGPQVCFYGKNLWRCSMFQGLGRGSPSVVARRTYPGRHISVTLKGPSQLGESCRALLGLVLAVGLGPDPGSPSAFYTGALFFGRGHSCMYLSAVWTHGESRRVSGGRHASAP